MTTTRVKIAPEWWITTGVKTANGRKVLGPFVTRDLAIEVRTYMEAVERHHNYWVEDFAPEPGE